MIAVSDTGPLNYLILIEEYDVLQILFHHVSIPHEVFLELQHRRTPKAVSSWVARPPAWFEVVRVTPSLRPRETDNPLSEDMLGAADIACIELAQSLPECTLLVDDRLAKKLAMARNVRTSGTLAILLAAGQRGLLDFDKGAGAIGKNHVSCLNEDSSALSATMGESW